MRGARAGGQRGWEAEGMWPKDDRSRRGRCQGEGDRGEGAEREGRPIVKVAEGGGGQGGGGQGEGGQGGGS